MKLIKTPEGDVYNLDDCIIFDDNIEMKVTQKLLSEELFKKEGILVGDMKGGDEKKCNCKSM